MWWPCGGDGVLRVGGVTGACSSEGGPGIVELLNSAVDAAEVPVVLFLVLEENLARVETVCGSLLLALVEDLAGVEGILGLLLSGNRLGS